MSSGWCKAGPPEGAKLLQSYATAMHIVRVDAACYSYMSLKAMVLVNEERWREGRQYHYIEPQMSV